MKVIRGEGYIIQEALKQLAVRKGNWKYIPPGSIRERVGFKRLEANQRRGAGYVISFNGRSAGTD